MIPVWVKKLFFYEYGVNEARRDLSNLCKFFKQDEVKSPLILTKYNKPFAVLLAWDEYENLKRKLEVN